MISFPVSLPNSVLKEIEKIAKDNDCFPYVINSGRIAKDRKGKPILAVTIDKVEKE